MATTVSACRFDETFGPKITLIDSWDGSRRLVEVRGAADQGGEVDSALWKL